MSLMYAASDLLAQMPNPGGPLAPPGSDKVQLLLQWGLWIGCALGLAGIVVCVSKMAIEHNRGMGGGDGATNLWKPLASFVVLSNITGIAAAMATFG